MYIDQHDVRVFSRHDPSNREEFGLNELLYDVNVCRVAHVTSVAQGARLSYVRAPLWHVESELDNNTREAMYDFNKLVLGAAPFNLFVGPRVHDDDGYIDVLRPAAECCTGRVFVALVPHPARWDADTLDVVVSEI